LMAEAADATDPYKTAEPGAAAPGEVTLKRPIVGKACDFRTVTVADRLEEPVAAEAKNFSVAAKYETIRRMSELEINVDDIEAPGFHGYDENGELIYEDVPITTNDIRKTRRTAKEIRWKFGDIKEKGLAWEVLEDRHDPDPANADESAFFSSAIRAVDNSAAILRLVEGRIQAYKNAIRDCKKTAVELG
ncbi:MAG: hypothetical protein GY859_44215, partial [Desulfobacterales bacterium]|nr:hypothetical protein [Desulfobacterales bacterium]